MDEKTHLIYASRGFTVRREDRYAREYVKDYVDDKGRMARATIFVDLSGPPPDCVHVAVQATFRFQDIDRMPEVVQSDVAAIRGAVRPIEMAVVQVRCHQCGIETNEFYRSKGKILCPTCLG